MTNMQFKDTLSREIDRWRHRLIDATVKIDGLPSIQKHKLTQYINELRIMTIEMQERIDMLNENDDVDWHEDEEDVTVRMDDFRNIYNESSGVHMDYDYSG